ncbi:sensor histidine kinase [Murinocardiopsis flavida]|uniref:sensor histidine kinase n=1 Tax=Murinocardiopsis flavida TaxID=645275 RepID=UPI001FE9F55D|nr:sensor histidine kinase [Murinocardiopsis flavida]
MNLADRPARWAGIAVDAASGALFAAALAFQAVAIARSWGGGFWQFDLAAGAVVCALALARRRWRARTAVAGLAVAAAAVAVAWSFGLPSEPGPAMALGLSVLVGSAVRRLPPLTACSVAAGGGAVVAGSALAAAASASGSAVAVLAGAGWVAGLAAGSALRLLGVRREAAAERVRRDERLALARELHDVVAHHVTGIVIEAQAGRLDARGHPERAAESFVRIEDAGSDAMAAMRRVVGLLRGADGADRATHGPEGLRELVERFRADGPAVRLRLPDGDAAWPPEMAGTVYRVVQEALTNIARHAPHARSVAVGVARDRDAVTVEVSDDARPSAARQHRGGYGLIGMRERVEAFGGTLTAGPRPEGGWSVLATLPVPDRRHR